MRNVTAYHHTQKGPWYLLLLGMACFTLAMISSSPVPIGLLIILSSIAAIFTVTAFSFRSLTVSDQGDSLRVQFGPFPVFGTSIPYSEVRTVEAGRSTLLDGWGIHWVPWRGWTYNIWGYDCAVLHLENRTIRIGSDDVENLVRFLRERIGPLQR